MLPSPLGRRPVLSARFCANESVPCRDATLFAILGAFRRVAGVAQVVEQGTENPRVGGSTPSPGTKVFLASGSMPSIISGPPSIARLPCDAGALPEVWISAGSVGRVAGCLAATRARQRHGRNCGYAVWHKVFGGRSAADTGWTQSTGPRGLVCGERRGAAPFCHRLSGLRKECGHEGIGPRGPNAGPAG
jgi:hypothetical protein